MTTALVLRELVEGLAARGRMILYSSHVLDVLEKVCSQVLILCKGRVAAHDTIEHLRESMHESSLEGIFGQLTQGTEPSGGGEPHPGGDAGVNWLESTHGVQFELVRHFLRRMFDGEWSSSPGQWNRRRSAWSRCSCRRASCWSGKARSIRNTRSNTITSRRQGAARRGPRR